MTGLENAAEAETNSVAKSSLSETEKEFAKRMATDTQCPRTELKLGDVARVLINPNLEDELGRVFKPLHRYTSCTLTESYIEFERGQVQDGMCALARVSRPSSAAAVGTTDPIRVAWNSLSRPVTWLFKVPVSGIIGVVALPSQQKKGVPTEYKAMRYVLIVSPSHEKGKPKRRSHEGDLNVWKTKAPASLDAAVKAASATAKTAKAAKATSDAATAREDEEADATGAVAAAEAATAAANAEAEAKAEVDASRVGFLLHDDTRPELVRIWRVPTAAANNSPTAANTLAPGSPARVQPNGAASHPPESPARVTRPSHPPESQEDPIENEFRRLVSRAGKRKCMAAFKSVMDEYSDSEDSLQEALRGGDCGEATGAKEPKAEVGNVKNAEAWAARMGNVKRRVETLRNSNAWLPGIKEEIKEELCALSAWVESGCRVLLIVLHGPDLDLSGEVDKIIKAGECAPRHVEFVVCHATHFLDIKRALQQSCSESDFFDLVMFSGHGEHPEQFGNQNVPMCTSRLLARCVC